MQLIKYLYATNFVTGATVMVIELLGTRFLSPWFGGNLHVWTALITVTLVALSLGYFVGGYLADRFPQASVLYGLIFSAAAVLMAVLLVRDSVLELGAGVGNSFGTLGLGVGALVSAAVLFGLPLFILGTVAPYSVKLCAKEMALLGHTVGRLYAISTAGSFVGTVAAGFFLIPNFANIQTLAGCSAVLAILSCIYFLLFQKKPLPSAGGAVLIGLTALVGYQAGKLPAGTVQGGKREWQVIHQRNSFYGRIRVLDLRATGSDEWTWRYLLNDGLTQGRYDLTSEPRVPAAVFPFALADVVLTHKRDAKNALVLGLGAGFVPRILRKNGVEKVTSVEINPAMVEVAQEYFDFPTDAAWQEACPVVVEDARTFVKRCAAEGTVKYDLIVVDTFLGDNAPSHLLSYEMFADLRRIMSPDGAMGMNIFAAVHGPRSRLLSAIVRTLKEGKDGTGPFPNVHVYSEAATAIAHNVFLLAYDGEHRQRPPGKVTLVARGRWYDEVKNALVDQTSSLTDLDEAPVLIDDYNAAEYLDVAVKIRMRERVRDYWGTALVE